MEDGLVGLSPQPVKHDAIFSIELEELNSQTLCWCPENCLLVWGRIGLLVWGTHPCWNWVWKFLSPPQRINATFIFPLSPWSFSSYRRTNHRWSYCCQGTVRAWRQCIWVPALGRLSRCFSGDRNTVEPPFYRNDFDYEPFLFPSSLSHSFLSCETAFQLKYFHPDPFLRFCVPENLSRLYLAFYLWCGIVLGLNRTKIKKHSFLVLTEVSPNL